MRIQLLSVVGAVMFLTAGAAGCSKDEPAAAAPTGGTGAADVTIDGQAKQVDGPVVCATTDGRFSIAIGDVNGVVLHVTDRTPGDTATATRDGNTYTIKGTSSGSDPTGKQVGKPFEIVATCR